MSITGTDDAGTYTDTGINTLPTTRAAVHVDIHSVVTNLVEKDSGTNAAKQPVLPIPRRATGQRR